MSGLAAAMMIVLSAPFVSVQIHAVSSEDAALDSVEFLRKQGFDGYYLIEAGTDGLPVFKVRMGRFDDRAQAEKAGQRLRRTTRVPQFYVTTTGDEEVSLLSAAMEPLLEDSALSSGFLRDEKRQRRVRDHLHNYIIVYLLASGEPPGRQMHSAAVWDTNSENHREAFAVVSSNSREQRAYALYWDEDRYQVVQVEHGRKVELYDIWDITIGAQRYLVFRVERGGSLFRELHEVVVRWDEEKGNYRPVGRILLERDDRGEVGHRPRKYRAKTALADIDEDQEQEVIVTELDDAIASTRIYDWTGDRLVWLSEPRVVLDEWLSYQRMSRTQAAASLLGIGRAKAAAGNLVAAETAWRVLILQLPDTEHAGAAKTAIAEIAARKARADVRTGTGTELLAAGNADAAADEFGKALKEFPDYGPALYNLACASAKRGDSFGALVYLRHALRVDPERYRTKAAEEAYFKPLRSRVEYQRLMRP